MTLDAALLDLCDTLLITDPDAADIEDWWIAARQIAVAYKNIARWRAEPPDQPGLWLWYHPADGYVVDEWDEEDIANNDELLAANYLPIPPLPTTESP